MTVPQIMECTLRDGSYVINFQFTRNDTELIAGALERVGFELIEIGHGIGLGASENGMGEAAETDESYMQAAANTFSTAKWGMFCIPGIAELNHVDMAADYGMDFIRIGTNLSDVPDSKPFIERAKSRGINVCANFMKSYVSKPEVFVNRVLESCSYGADTIYLVDSAGGMLPADIRRYITAVRERSEVPMGFHGHNNLGLGIANALCATELGVSVIDTSLQGFGRSGGNVSTEQFLCALQRQGIETGIDPVDVMDVAEKFIVPLITARGLNSLDIVSGLAQFHSSYMGIIKEVASKYSVDPRRLILAVCDHDKVDAPYELVEKQAKQLAEKSQHSEIATSDFRFDRYFGEEQK